MIIFTHPFFYYILESYIKFCKLIYDYDIRGTI